MQSLSHRPATPLWISSLDMDLCCCVCAGETVFLLEIVQLLIGICPLNALNL